MTEPPIAPELLPLSKPLSEPLPEQFSEQLVDLMANLLGLTISPEHRPGVMANMERNAAIAQRVMEFPLPDEIEIAPIFQP